LRHQESRFGCVITQPDKPQGRGNEIQFSPIKKFALSKHIPVVQPESIKKIGDRFLEIMSDYGPFEIGVVIAFGQILPQAVLDLPKHGCVNIHASLLPRWRGAAPIQRAIMAGDKETGICLMKMEAGLDTGPVYCADKVAIEDFDTFEILHDRLSHLGAKFLAGKISDIAAGRILPVPQKSEGVTYAHKITNEESLIDWQKPAKEIANMIRGLNPFPGAYTITLGKRLKIFQSIPVKPMHNGSFTPGQIVMADPARLEVQCGNGVLNILELQLEGKKKMSVSDFLKGNHLQVGESLGPANAH